MPVNLLVRSERMSAEGYGAGGCDEKWHGASTARLYDPVTALSRRLARIAA